MSRNWSCKNTSKLKSAKVTRPYRDNKNLYRINFSVMKDGFPDYRLKFRDKIISLDQVQISRLLRATLNEYRPKCCLHFKTKKGEPRAVTGRIISFYYLPDNQSKYKVGEPFPFVLYFKMSSKYKLPNTLKKIKLNISSKLLPKKIYQYGFCDVYGDKFNKCTDSEYLTAPGISLVPDNGVNKGRSQCMVFRLRPPNSPKSYCKFDIGF